MSGFEPPAPEGPFPSFRSLFGSDHLYLELLHLPTARPSFAAVEAAVASSSDADREIASLFAERNWRPHLVGAAALLATGVNPSRLDALWSALAQGSWVAPQLAVTAFLLDDDFEARARTLILGESWPKTRAALGHLYRQLPSPRVQVIARLADPALASDVDARDGALYAAEWLAKLVNATTPEMRAKWRRSPA